MGYRPLPSCQHRDNYDRCRVHSAPWIVRWLMPKGRPLCVFAYRIEPQDGEIKCAEQLPYPRPATPAPMPRKK